MKKYIYIAITAIIFCFITVKAASFKPSTFPGQDVIVADTIDADALFAHEPVTQHSWEEYEWVDTCTARFAVVHDWYGRCGIYDLENKRNITELEYRDLFLTRSTELEKEHSITVFIGYQGHRKGIVSVDPSGDVMSISLPDTELCYSLEACRTIDKKISKVSRNLLEKDMKKAGALHGQVFVMESQTGNIKAWIALEDEFGNGKYSDAPLLKHQCSTMPLKALYAISAIAECNISWNDSVDTRWGCDSIGGMWIKDYNWHKGGFGKVSFLYGFKMHSDITMLRALEKLELSRLERTWQELTDKPRETDVLNLATIYNAAAVGAKNVVMPCVNTDSIKFVSANCFGEADILTAQKAKEYLKATLQEGGIGSKWTTKKVDMSGDYSVIHHCRPTLYDENIAYLEKYRSKESIETYSQIVFVGYFPSNNPRYTICVTMDKATPPLYVTHISRTVNKLAEYLNSH